MLPPPLMGWCPADPMVASSSGQRASPESLLSLDRAAGEGNAFDGVIRGGNGEDETGIAMNHGGDDDAY